MSRSAVFALLIIVFLVLGTSIYCNAQNMDDNVRGISIKIVYDPYMDYGIVTYEILFSKTMENTIIDLPLVADNINDIINVTGSEGQVFPYTYINENTSISILINNTDTLIITYEISGFMDEVGIDAYSGILDLSLLSGMNVSVEIVLPSVFNVSTEPRSSYVEYDDGLTIIKINNPGIYAVYVEKSLLATTTTISPPTTTTTPAPLSSITSTTTTTTTTPSTTTVSSHSMTTTTSPTSPNTVSPRETVGLSPFMIGLIIAVIVIIVLIALLLRR
ncbi:hypothetical protein [Staphylothermus hellenicus]|uniref:Uncharacterized protein n=1 Tax=Staphylothermus hellenicus (strain DSM 12710 / JCM 10830 / BK20S6-10-b1 / P8) TaxID=591019 RepID=D7DBG1_STAHD|nr:hypothetical protein [Staphylothermus hellenicus]ADI31508.1 hypothetical protein Shell_0376 [Staphylothermus hellenicus DSM 12710]